MVKISLTLNRKNNEDESVKKDAEGSLENIRINEEENADPIPVTDPYVMGVIDGMAHRDSNNADSESNNIREDGNFNI